MALEVARTPHLAPYLRLEPGFQARLFPDQEMAIERVARAHCPQSAAQLVRAYRNLATAYCLNHADEGWDPPTARARLREAAGRPALGPTGDIETEYRSDRTLERYWSSLVEAGLIRLEKFGRRRARIVRVYLPGVLERHGGLEAHRDRAARRMALARQYSAAHRARRQDDRFETSPTSVSPSALGGADSFAVKAISQPIPGFSPTSLSPSAKHIETKDPRTNAICSDVRTSSPRPIPQAKFLHNQKSFESQPSATRGLKVGGGETGTPSSPPLDPSAPEETVEKRERETPEATGSAGLGCEKNVGQEGGRQDPGELGTPLPTLGQAAAPRVTVEAKTPPQRAIAGPGQTIVQPRRDWQGCRSAAEIASWLAQGNAERGQTKPRPPTPKRSPAPASGLTVASSKRGQLTQAQVAYIPPPPSNVAPKVRHSVHPWQNGSLAYSALEELTVEGATAEVAEQALGPVAWEAAFAVQPWSEWLKRCDHRLAYDAFHAYERMTQARGCLTAMPQGVPTTPAGFCEHAQAYFGGDPEIVGVNGVALAALAPTQDAWNTALQEAGCAVQRGRVTAGKPLAGYLLAIVQRLVAPSQTG